MKHCLRFLPLFLFLLFCNAVFAVHPSVLVQEKGTPALTVNQFLSLDPALISRKNGHENAWFKRNLIRYAQQRLHKKVAAGKIKGEDALFQSDLRAKRPNQNGMWSLILGGAGFIFLFAGPLAFLSFPMAVGSFIFGLRGLKTDDDHLMAILGIVFSVMITLIFVLAIAFIASYLSWF